MGFDFSRAGRNTADGTVASQATVVSKDPRSSLQCDPRSLLQKCGASYGPGSHCCNSVFENGFLSHCFNNVAFFPRN
jgi:hypothetical protein